MDGIESEVYVVDNHSHDDSISYLSSRFPKVNFIDSNHNLGFARANNIAIKQSTGEYVLLLNPDTFVAEDTIRKAVTFMDEHTEAGGAGVKMYNSDGLVALESRRGVPTPLTSFLKMMGLTRRYYMSQLPWNEPARIEIISGACCLLRRSALKRSGLLDEDFFMYGEDIDLSYRLLKKGYQNWYLPLPIVHYKGESTQKSSFRYVHVFYQAMLIFFRKHYGHMSFLFTFPIKIAIYFKALIALMGMLMGRMRRSLGFTDNKSEDADYFFVGSPEMIEQCRHIARRKGLSAEFYTVNKSCKEYTEHPYYPSPNNGHITYAVYDMELFGYDDVIRIISHQPQENIILGTFYSKTGIIITPHDIIK